MGKPSSIQDAPERLWTVEDLADFLNMTRKAAYGLVERPGGPPAIRVGERRLVIVPRSP